MNNERLDMSKIDEQINQARKRKDTRTSTGDTHVQQPADKEERERAKAEEKERKRVEREEAREAKRREREANRKPAHMAKVEKVLARLPKLPQRAQEDLDTLLSRGHSLAELENLAAHVTGHVRLERTRQALDRTLEAGQTVRIVGGDPRFIGSTGTVARAQRIRCYVDIPGHGRQVYLFTSDVEPVEDGTEVQPEATQDEEDQAATG